MHPYNIEAILMLWAHVIIQACADVEEGIRYQLKNGRYKKSKPTAITKTSPEEIIKTP